ncbi:MAG: PH domain-containing protein [Thermoguttaceae bacterium]|nr:PH domain-containing protein [Thermoguttaceae bacterium]
MEKRIIYQGSPSQITNLIFYIFWGIVSIFTFGITVVFIIWRFLATKCTKTTITTTEIISEHGILSKTTDELLLKRITDVHLNQPFFLRIFGLSNIIVTTTDVTDGALIIKAVPNGKKVWQQLREAIAECRKTVYEQELRHV